MQKVLIFPLHFVLLLYAATATAGNVVASIKPLHSLVQSVMGDTGKADLLVGGDRSPHGLSLKPSQIKMLHAAKTVFYIDDTFESFLPRIFASLPSRVRRIAVARNSHLTLFNRRESGAWEAHTHHPRENAETHDHSDDLAHDHPDMHLWLDADNAQQIVAVVATELAVTHPENRDAYRRNARVLTARIKKLDAELQNKLAAVKNRPFVVFHDAYQYFERRYGLNGVGSITVEPHDALSINRLRQIRGKIKSGAAACVFQEPQPTDKLQAVVKGSDVKIGTLDPLGADLTPGPDLYFDLLKNLADDFVRCLH